MSEIDEKTLEAEAAEEPKPEETAQAAEEPKTETEKPSEEPKADEAAPAAKAKKPAKKKSNISPETWEKLEGMKNDGTVVTVSIQEAVKGGVVGRLEGVRAFIPASHLSAGFVEDLNTWVGKEVEAQVITADREKNSLVLSARKMARKQRDEEKKKRIEAMTVGAELDGKVESIMSYGAFIDLGDGISGLVHISQISDHRIETVDEVLKVGQQVKARVIGVKDGKVSLSMKPAGSETETPARGNGGGRRERDNAPSQEYISNENASTSLGDILSKIKL
ncbi:MAG: S1 RNA-binding domain-containing protein [Clostridiales bacterium]|nr:S1 RNA-binding domain-containing protein [Clostridiales bacterium]